MKTTGDLPQTMDDGGQVLPAERVWPLFEAAGDFLFLLNRSYPRTAALELTGNRYGLSSHERMILSRGLFNRWEALARLGKRRRGESWRRGLLAVDGHNVQITVESFIEAKPLIRANDGALRDLAGQSYRYRMTESSRLAADMIFAFLEKFPPAEVLFLFDQPMSMSGEIAAMYRERLARAGIRGKALAAPVPEREFPYNDCVTASSDRAVIDASTGWIDLACAVIELHALPVVTADFSGVLTARATLKRLLEAGGAIW